MHLILYRGDSFENTRTHPGRYRGDGLTSKSFYGKDDPKYINKMGLLESIRVHINRIIGLEDHIYDQTGYLSFSEDRELALKWAKYNDPVIETCDTDYLETRYVFTAILPWEDIETLSEGVYKYTFACNLKLKQANSSDPIGTYFLQAGICDVCGGIERNHNIILIDSVRFLERHRHLEAYAGAYLNAVRDKEWLILPNDPLGSSTSARIQRANFWKAEHYVVPGEPQRQPEDGAYAFKGLIYEL